jgi:hypothetical protein
MQVACWNLFAGVAPKVTAQTFFLESTSETGVGVP